MPILGEIKLFLTPVVPLLDPDFKEDSVVVFCPSDDIVTNDPHQLLILTESYVSHSAPSPAS